MIFLRVEDLMKTTVCDKLDVVVDLESSAVFFQLDSIAGGYTTRILVCVPFS